MTTALSTMFRRIGLITGAGLIALSASTFVSPVTMAAAPGTNTGQVPPNQPPFTKDQKKSPNNGGTQSGQAQNGQPQNGQAQNGQAQNGQQWGQQNGQSHTQNPHYDWTAYQPGHQPAQWQQHQQDFNPRAYEINGDSENRYHWQHYVQPRGWHYQRYAYGQTLPPAYWGREYWLDGYSQFGLINPPYGYVWVRYGNDAMLLSVISGLILSVQYGVFYS
jgi:Ni/Co efflux regulator RcnB